MPSYRALNLLLFVAAVVGMFFALYLQYVQYLEPCPLCIFQRIGLIGMGLVAFIAFIVNPQSVGSRRIWSLLALLGAGWSLVTAGRHVWLQHLPADQVPACGPGLEYWLDVLPLTQVFAQVFSGSGECAMVDWELMGFSLPEWSLAFFALLTLVILWQLIRPVTANSIFTAK